MQFATATFLTLATVCLTVHYSRPQAQNTFLYVGVASATLTAWWVAFIMLGTRSSTQIAPGDNVPILAELVLQPARQYLKVMETMFMILCGNVALVALIKWLCTPGRRAPDGLQWTTWAVNAAFSIAACWLQYGWPSDAYVARISLQNVISNFVLLQTVTQLTRSGKEVFGNASAEPDRASIVLWLQTLVVPIVLALLLAAFWVATRNTSAQWGVSDMMVGTRKLEHLSYYRENVQTFHWQTIVLAVLAILPSTVIALVAWKTRREAISYPRLVARIVMSLLTVLVTRAFYYTLLVDSNDNQKFTWKHASSPSDTSTQQDER